MHRKQCQSRPRLGKAGRSLFRRTDRLRRDTAAVGLLLVRLAPLVPVPKRRAAGGTKVRGHGQSLDGREEPLFDERSTDADHVGIVHRQDELSSARGRFGQSRTGLPSGSGGPTCAAAG